MFVCLACSNRNVYKKMDISVGKQNFIKNIKNLELWITILFITFSGFKKPLSYNYIYIFHFLIFTIIPSRSRITCSSNQCYQFFNSVNTTSFSSFSLCFHFVIRRCQLFTVRRRLDKCLMSLIVCAKCPNLNSLSS